MFNTEVHLSFHKAAFTVKFAEVDERGSILNDDLDPAKRLVFESEEEALAFFESRNIKPVHPLKHLNVSCAFTSRDMSYKVGTDEEGNKWYFIPDKMDAAYVHPAVYQGFRCNTSEVRYIRELVFPSVIMYNGTDYIVRSIGGGTVHPLKHLNVLL